ARAARVDHVEHPDALTDQLPLDPEIRVRFGNDADGPSRTVRGRALRTKRRDLRSGEVLGAWTVGTIRLPGRLGFRPDEDPMSSRRVLPQLIHGIPHSQRMTTREYHAAIIAFGAAPLRIHSRTRRQGPRGERTAT